MLWGVISDIHSNFDALQAVLKVLKKRGAEGTICCGDIVGYGPEPNKVVERLRELPSLQCIHGNHDLAVSGRMRLSWFNESAQAAVKFTQKILTKENKTWLGKLPSRVEGAGFTAVHGSPRNPAEEYLLTAQQFLDNCAYFKASPCFIGHSHLPICFLMKEPLSYVEVGILSEGQPLKIPLGTRGIFNPGSVGQPRDHDSRASCGLYDDKERTFQLVRVVYDVSAVQKKILKAGLPEFLALRLSYGQ